MESEIYKEIAESYLTNQLEVLQNLSAKIDFPFIATFAREAEDFLKSSFQQIKTKKDLLEFQELIDTLEEINGIFIRTTDDLGYWAMPLIKQFYTVLNIDLTTREILIVNDSSVSYINGGYSVMVDLFNDRKIKKLDFLYAKKVDVFYLPRQSNFSISSIALLAHEVGHVYFSCQSDIQREIADRIVRQLITDDKIKDLFENAEAKLSRTNITSQIEEFFCDNIGHYLLGPVYNFAAVKMLGITDEDSLTFMQGTHPPVFKRLYNEKERFVSFLSQLKSGTKIFDAATKIKERYFDDFSLIPPLVSAYDNQDDEYYINLATDIAKEVLYNYLQRESLYTPQEYGSILNKCLENLNRLIPPIETLSIDKPETINPSEMIVATTFYFSGNIFETDNEFYAEADGSPDEKRQKLKNILINFIRYSINVYSFYGKVKQPFPANPLLTHTVWNLRDRGKDGGNPFVVVPTIDFERQYATNAVDLRLGNSFITSKLTEFTHIPTKPSENPLSDKNIEYFFEKHFIPYNKNFTLHPHSFVLAVTLEYICIPADHYALVLGRSTWGRLGLNIATATAVGPGFKGCITLELRNLSEVPITLNVGTRICQICLIKNPEEKGKLAYYLNNNNKYICPTEAEYPKIDKDPDWEILRKFSE